MARLFVLLGGLIAEAVRSPAGLLSRSSSLSDPAHVAWRQQFEASLDTSLTRNLQALDQLLKHSTALGQHFMDFQNAALAMTRQSKNLEHQQAASHNRINGPEFNNAVGGAQQQLGKLQADMQATFQKMEHNYQTVTDRTKQTKALMDQVMNQKQAADAKHQQVQQRHADMLRDMQRDQSAFDNQMQKVQGVMTVPEGSPPATTEAPLPPLGTPAPGAPAPDKYEVMIDGLEQQQAELDKQMRELDGLLGESTTAFMAAMNATSTLKAQNTTTII